MNAVKIALRASGMSEINNPEELSVGAMLDVVVQT
jgi:hypothetical protein